MFRKQGNSFRHFKGYFSNRHFDSPSGKIEFYSSQAEKLGLPPLPVHTVDKGSLYPLALSFGRTLTHFHSFYDEGRALASLAKHNTAPLLWMSAVDADARQLSDGDAIRIFNERGEFAAKAHVTNDVPPGVVWFPFEFAIRAIPRAAGLPPICSKRSRPCPASAHAASRA